MTTLENCYPRLHSIPVNGTAKLGPWLLEENLPRHIEEFLSNLGEKDGHIIWTGEVNEDRLASTSGKTVFMPDWSAVDGRPNPREFSYWLANNYLAKGYHVARKQSCIKMDCVSPDHLEQLPLTATARRAAVGNPKASDMRWTEPHRLTHAQAEFDRLAPIDYQGHRIWRGRTHMKKGRNPVWSAYYGRPSPRAFAHYLYTGEYVPARKSVVFGPTCDNILCVNPACMHVYEKSDWLRRDPGKVKLGAATPPTTPAELEAHSKDELPILTPTFSLDTDDYENDDDLAGIDIDSYFSDDDED